MDAETATKARRPGDGDDDFGANTVVFSVRVVCVLWECGGLIGLRPEQRTEPPG